ncbi:DUF4291 domain-containing protein [Vitiosangium sp. GDMCC 1.1324]|uniref:DUF4291 domain-containing protein n=1 Tax=Vitiosangium sp. (strain GDMCC 1.1324) TaxID=2138576 RepID=UPI000D3AD9ED|nr:DUF4291 domain-containing protein [Vitiosangium sp. GDMCC 1.1324]PTL78440.1 DUF4291 domain-containing protein [Vitiosangium sp. GDMCC 1.1324]
MPLITESYAAQHARWPATGRHILAQHDERSVVVYQAYAPRIGRFAAEHRFFGGDFKLTRMSWIKPNFLWMMYRCGWATKTDQETVLAVWLRREAFESVLAQAVHSKHVPEVYGSHEAWREQGARSDVRLQWDPDHSPTGAPQQRRAIQLGLQGETLRRYAKEWILDIEDITPFVREQREHIVNHRLGELITPRETVFQPGDEATVRRLGLDAPS